MRCIPILICTLIANCCWSAFSQGEKEKPWEHVQIFRWWHSIDEMDPRIEPFLSSVVDQLNEREQPLRIHVSPKLADEKIYQSWIEVKARNEEMEAGGSSLIGPLMGTA